MRVTRELVITYGAYVIDGTVSNDRFLDGYIRVDEGPDLATVEFDFVIQKASESDFAAEVAAAEAAFRTPRQLLSIVQGGETLYSFSHSGNTGFNSRPKIIKAEDIVDTGRSRRYTVSIEFDMPADTYSTEGRRDSAVQIQFDRARIRTVTIGGTYTALTSNAAYAQYLSAIDTYTSTVLTALGGTYELQQEDDEYDDQNKLMTFSRVFKELIYDQVGGTLDDPAIVDQTLMVTRGRMEPGDSRQSRRWTEVSLDYRASIDKTVTTDLNSKYDSDIRPWLIQNITDVFGEGAGALVEESPQFDGPNNVITCRMKMLTPRGRVLESNLTVGIRDDQGKILAPFWDGDIGISYYEYQGPRKILRTVNEFTKVVGTVIAQAKVPGAPKFVFNAPAGGGVAAGRQAGAAGGAAARAVPGFGGGGLFGFRGANFRPGVNIFGQGQNNRKGLRGPRGINPAVRALGELAGGKGKGAGDAGGAGGGAGGPAVAAKPAANGPRWLLIDENEQTTPLTLGIDGHTINTTDITNTTVEQLIKTPERVTVSISPAAARARGF
jgi:hypothetical protein